MLADPRHSGIILLNLGRFNERAGEDACARFLRDVSLLAEGLLILEVPIYIAGDWASEPKSLAAIATQLDIDPAALWRDAKASTLFGAADLAIVYFGGAWLEEDVLLGAVESVQIGYDVRVFSDICVSRNESEQASVLQRLSQHGVLMTTVRQTLLEWALSRGEPEKTRAVRELL